LKEEPSINIIPKKTETDMEISKISENQKSNQNDNPSEGIDNIESDRHE